MLFKNVNIYALKHLLSSPFTNFQNRKPTNVETYKLKNQNLTSYP